MAQLSKRRPGAAGVLNSVRQRIARAPALDLPFLSYGSVFMIGLVFYWLAVVGRIEREKQEGGAGQNEKR